MADQLKEKVERVSFTIRTNGALCGIDEDGSGELTVCDAADLDDYDNYRCVKYGIALEWNGSILKRCEDCLAGRRGWRRG